MTSDLDIYRTANLLVRQHGNEAPIHAGMRADELMATGDMEGCGVWLRVIEAIKALLAEKPEGAVH